MIDSALFFRPLSEIDKKPLIYLPTKSDKNQMFTPWTGQNLLFPLEPDKTSRSEPVRRLCVRKTRAPPPRPNPHP
jgi:hypothetical protein